MNPIKKLANKKRAAEHFLQGVGHSIVHKKGKTGITFPQSVGLVLKTIGHMPKSIFDRSTLKKRK